MGVTEDNVEVQVKLNRAEIVAHIHGILPVEFWLSADSASSVSPLFDYAGYTMLTATAKQGYYAFESAAEALLPGWFMTLTPFERNDAYNWFTARIGEARFRLHRGDQNVDITSVYASNRTTLELMAYAVGPTPPFSALAGMWYGADWHKPEMTQQRKEHFKLAYEALL